MFMGQLEALNEGCCNCNLLFSPLYVLIGKIKEYSLRKISLKDICSENRYNTVSNKGPSIKYIGKHGVEGVNFKPKNSIS